MAKKRFKYYNHKGADYILDTPNKSLDFIEMLGDCLEAEEIVDLLNELHEEKEVYKHLWEEMSYYFKDGVSLKDLDNKDFRTLQRLAKGLVD